MAFGPDFNPDDMVFCRGDGKPIHPERLISWFGQAVKRAGLPKTRLHDMRHSYATMLLRQGVPLRVVSQRIGHASPLITMSVYAHVLDGDDEEPLARVLLRCARWSAPTRSCGP